MNKEIKKPTIKSLYFTEEQFKIWVEYTSKGVTSIRITDMDQAITYDIADFNGAKYQIKNNRMFNGIFIKSIKKRPQLFRDLIKFHGAMVSDGNIFTDLSSSISSLRRKLNVKTKRQINRVRHKIW